MENKYYTIDDIQTIMGISKLEAGNLIRKLNAELKIMYEFYQIKPLIKKGLIAKDYFIKRMEIEI